MATGGKVERSSPLQPRRDAVDCFMILEAHPALQKLSLEEKQQLITELCEETSQAQIDVDDETRQLLEKRLADHAASPDAVSTTAEVTQRILKLAAEIARRKTHG
jgi:putative addiction module component (TIGR02574 family)